MKIFKSLITTLLFLFVLTRPAFAANSSSGPKTAQEQTQTRVQACKAREAALRNRMTNLLRFSNNMSVTFDNITKRVEEFYQKKVLSEGKSAKNYDVLIANIEAKKTALGGYLAKAETNSNSFNCDSENPKTSLTNFRKDMQAVKNGLKEYRTAIKNLIIAVRGVSNAIENGVLTVTPKPNK